MNEERSVCDRIMKRMSRTAAHFRGHKDSFSVTSYSRGTQAQPGHKIWFESGKRDHGTRQSCPVFPDMNGLLEMTAARGTQG